MKDRLAKKALMALALAFVVNVVGLLGVDIGLWGTATGAVALGVATAWGIAVALDTLTNKAEK